MDQVSNLARKLIAVAVLLIAAWFLFKVLLGIVSTIAWFLAVLVALAAVVWAVRTL
jgi:hypothetical protein